MVAHLANPPDADPDPAVPELDLVARLERTLLEFRRAGADLPDDRRARLAIEIFCYRARKYIGAYLAALDGSCETPIAGLAELDGGTIRLRGEILRIDGTDALADGDSAPVEDAAELGRAVAARLLDRAGPGFFDWRTG